MLLKATMADDVNAHGKHSRVNAVRLDAQQLWELERPALELIQLCNGEAMLPDQVMDWEHGGLSKRKAAHTPARRITTTTNGTAISLLTNYAVRASFITANDSG